MDTETDEEVKIGFRQRTGIFLRYPYWELKVFTGCAGKPWAPNRVVM